MRIGSVSRLLITSVSHAMLARGSRRPSRGGIGAERMRHDADHWHAINVVRAGKGRVRRDWRERDVWDRRRHRPEEISPYGRFKHRQQGARHSVIDDVVNRTKLFEVHRTQRCGLVPRRVAIRIEARPEKFNEPPRQLRAGQKRTLPRSARGGQPHLEGGGEIRAQQSHFVPGQAGAQGQQVEPIVFGLAGAHRHQRIANQGRARLLLQRFPFSTVDAKCLEVGQLRFSVQRQPELVCLLGHYRNAKILQERNQLGEQWRLANLIQPQFTEVLFGFGSGTADQHAETALLQQPLDLLDEEPLAGPAVLDEHVGQAVGHHIEAGIELQSGLHDHARLPPVHAEQVVHEQE